jgi:H+/Cl- antiporter ClcA
MAAKGVPVRLLLLGALLGVPAAASAVLFESVLHGATTLVWHGIPDGFGWSEPKWWYVVLVPAVAGVLVAGTLRMPGKGGHTALEGLSMDPPALIGLPSVLAAGIISLAGGVVLGPEAPILALGLAVGVATSRLTEGSDETTTRTLALAGAFAAMAGLFGGSLALALFFFEGLTKAGNLPAPAIARVMLPGFLGSGVGALIFTGVHNWSGVHEQSLALPGLAAYPTVRLVDVAWCLVLAAVITVGMIAIRAAARSVDARVRLPVLSRLVIAGLAIGAIATVFRALADRPVDFVLFSGQASTGDYIAEGSAGVLIAVIGFKGLGYLVSLASGFRGGPIFPSVSLGVAVGALAANVLPGLALTPAIVAGVAAGATAAVGLPFFGALLAVLLAGGEAAETAPIAVIASVVAWALVTFAVNRMDEAG